MPSPRARLNRSVVVGIAAAVFASLLAAGPATAQTGMFDDVPDDAYYSVSVAALAEDGVFAGTECDEGFCPGEPIDRATMAVWSVRVLDGVDPPPVASTRFEDVGGSHPHAAFIERFAELGVTQGCGDGTNFCPDDSVTRAQMAVFLSRAYSLADGPNPDFSDVAAGAWYRPDVARLVASGITKGCRDGSVYCPDRPTTRAQMATFLYRAGKPTRPGSEQTIEDSGQTTASTAFELNPAMDGGGVISAGSSPCGLRPDQTVLCWGRLGRGELDFPEGRFLGVSASVAAACGLRPDQTLECWGIHYMSRHPPSGRFTAVSVGGMDSFLDNWQGGDACAVRLDQTLLCWDSGFRYRSDVPSGRFSAVSVGAEHSCALSTDSSIVCWGGNDHGQSDPPAGSFQAVSAGWFHSCGLSTDSRIVCWGGNDRGESDPPAGPFQTVSAGKYHSCGLRSDSTIACWGASADWSDRGQTDAPPGRFLAVSAGFYFSCGQRPDRTVDCWGQYEPRTPVPLPALWEPTPRTTECQPAGGETGRPGVATGLRIVQTGALDWHGALARPAVLEWASPCRGGQVDHYIVEWRPGHKSFSDERHHTVEATPTSNEYSFDLPDLDVYEVRVTAVNRDGRSQPAPLIVSTPSNELRTATEAVITRFQDDYPWLTDTWAYMNRAGDYVIDNVHYWNQRPLAFISSSARCVFPHGGGCISAGSLALEPFHNHRPYIILHELAHIHTLYNDLAVNAAAVGAGHLYVIDYLVRHGAEGSGLWWCQTEEVYADLAVMIVLEEARRRGYWYQCDAQLSIAAGLGLTLRFDFSQELVDVLRSVFIDQEVPQWFYDTYQQPNGTFDVDSIRSALEADLGHNGV